jgi:TonB family protein
VRRVLLVLSGHRVAQRLVDNHRMLKLLPRRLAGFLASIVLLAALPGLAAAGDTPSSTAGLRSLLTDRRVALVGEGVMVSPGASWYPEAEAAAGAQGMAIVVMDMAPDGSIASSRLAFSTHSPVLDEQALRLAGTLHWMGAGKTPPQASLRVLFSRDDSRSVQDKSCAELNVDIAWLKAHDPDQPPEVVGALQSARGMVILNTSWMPDRSDREAGRPVRDALFVASRRTVAECAAHPDQRMKDIFNRVLYEASQAHEHEPALPTPPARLGKLPRTILHTRRDDPYNAGTVAVGGKDPAYPAAALAAGAQGNVDVVASLGDGGAIADVIVTHDYSGSPLLAGAALDIARRRIAEAQLETRDPSTLPAAILLNVSFERDDSASVLALDCATYRVDAGAWRGDLLRLPDFQTMTTVLSMRHWGRKGVGTRVPRRDISLFTDKEREAEVRGLDKACAAEPNMLALDALVDVIDAMPQAR